VDIKHLISVYSVPHIAQVHMWYRAHLRLPDTAEAAEALAATEPFILHAPANQTPAQEAESKKKYGFAPAHESSAVGLFPLNALPWGSFAFPSAEGSFVRAHAAAAKCPHTRYQLQAHAPRTGIHRRHPFSFEDAAGGGVTCPLRRAQPYNYPLD